MCNCLKNYWIIKKGSFFKKRVLGICTLEDLGNNLSVTQP